MSDLDNTISTEPGEPCGEKVRDPDGKLLGFCEFQRNHPGPHSHLLSEYRVWWDGSDRLRGKA